MMKFLLTIILFVSHSYADCFKDIPKPKRTAKLTYYFFDLYKLAYHESQEQKQLALHYLRDIKKEHSMEGWKTGFKDNIKDSKVLASVEKKVEKFTSNMKEGDCLKFIVKENKGKVLLNKKSIHEFDDKQLARYILSPWLGAKPVSESVKNTLLGK